MATPEASRNIPYNFSPATFRNAIQFVMEMGTPPELPIQPEFHFTELVSYLGPADGDQVPFDPAQPVTRTTAAPVKVPCVVEFKAASDFPTAFGQIIPAKVEILLLDVDYVQVKEATFVVINGDKYTRLYEQPSFGLFQVGLHTMVFQAENEI